MAGRDFSAELFGSEDKTAQGRDFSAQLFESKSVPERTTGEAFADVGAKLVSGLGGLAQFPGQVYGLTTGAIKKPDFATTGLYGIGKEMQDWAKAHESEALKAKEAATAEKVAEAEKQGQWEAFKTQAGEVIKDPAQLAAFLAEQAPQAIPSMIAAMIPGVGPAAAAEIRAAQLAARTATSVAAKQAAEVALQDAVTAASKSAISRGATSAVRTAAVQQGADIGTGTYENTYKYLIEHGATPEEAANESINLARAAGVGGAALSLLAAKLPGAQAFERALAGEKVGLGKGIGARVAQAGVGALKEIPGEEVEEVGGKLLQNIAQRQVNPEQSLTSGLGQTAAQAAIGAGGMGGVGGMLSGRTTTEAARSSEELPPETTPAVPLETAATPASTEEVAAQRLPVIQKRIEEDMAAQEERDRREGPRHIAPEVAPTEVSRFDTEVPKPESREELLQKQADIDKMRLEAGLPTGPSSETPGVEPVVKVPEEVLAPKIVDNRPLQERAAQNRLLVMQNILQNQGGDPNSLAIVPHPTVENRFAIQSLDVPVKFKPEMQGKKSKTGRARETTVTRIDETGKPYTETTETPSGPGIPVGLDPIKTYIDIARRTNTPASMRLVRDFDAGLVTREDVQAAIDAERKAGLPLPLNYTTAGEPWFLLPETSKPRGERELPASSRLTKAAPEGPVRPGEFPVSEEPPTEAPPVTPTTGQEPPTGTTPQTLEEFKQLMPVSRRNPEYAIANKAGNFKQLADVMATSKNPAIKRIGELSRGIANKVTLHKPGNAGSGNAGVFRYSDNSIKMARDYADDEHTNAHESLHALIARAQRYPNERQAPVAAQIKKLYLYTKKELDRKGKGSFYGLTNEREFTAEAMTNPEFQYELMQIPYAGNRSAWTQFVKLVADLLGIKDTNALTEVMNLTDKLARIKQSHAAAEKGAVEATDTEAMQLPFVKRPTVATVTESGKQSEDILNSLGRAPEVTLTAKEKFLNTYQGAMNDPKGTAASAKQTFTRFMDKLETWTFSSDAALNNQIKREITESMQDQADITGALLETSLSQTVHSNAISSLFLELGDISYNKEIHKWEGKKSDATFKELSNILDRIADKTGLTKERVEQMAHLAFEAKRLQSVEKFNAKVDAEVADMRSEAADLRRAGKPVAASALSDKASRRLSDKKTVHMESSQISAAMELFKIHPELNEVVKKWNDIRANSANVMIESGLWSEQEAEELLSNMDYVPFYREQDNIEGDNNFKARTRSLMVAAKDKKFKGSQKPVNDIFENQIKWVEFAINRAVRNRSAVALAKAAEESKLAQKVESGKDAVRVWENGKEVFYKMDDPMYMDAFKGLEGVAIPTIKWASNMTALLRNSVVMYPLFSLSQIPQDSIAAIFSSGLKPQYALRIPVLAVKEFVKTLGRQSATHNILKNVGAVGVRDFNSQTVRNDIAILSELKGKPGFFKQVMSGLNHFSMAADNAVRQATFIAAEQQGLSRGEAMEKAFEVFNARRKGSSKMLAVAGQVIPFFPAYLAAQHVAYKVLTGRGISPQQREDAYKTLMATTGSVMALSLLYAMMNGDDEDYLKKTTTMRDRVFVIPGTGGLSIPMRPDVFAFPKIITEHMYLMMTDKGFEDGRKFRDSMASALGTAVLGPTPVPQAVKPLVEVGLNYDFFQGRPLVGTYQKALDTERQFTDSTSELAKWIGSSGLISPINADHLFRGMFGSVGGLITYATNPFLHSDPDVPRPSLSIQEAMAALPGTSGFITKEYDNSLKKDFYVLKEEVDKAAKTMKDIEQRSPHKLKEAYSDKELVIRSEMQKDVAAMSKELAGIHREIAAITNSTMPADQKSAQIRMLNNMENQVLKSMNIKQMRKMASL